ncbi:unnamed protein product (mitochondrion) [Plasmodiophora brassicae]|uniref:Uncharacterized protein n=1 Tax=Plasmodiophora brassicae TaxID=37360 RepID=A0A3P3YFK4_PLABS|nr:unnamed protein product [Plasmodiophora brassicae]
MAVPAPVALEIHALPSGTGSYGIVKMQRPPANALVQLVVDGIVSAIDTMEANPAVKGFLITSSVPGFFSAGIDLSLFVGEMKPWLHFWKSLRNMFLRIYTSKLVSIACIQGHAPGGGAIISLACHYRFMLNGKAAIGLNEVAVGLTVPRWLCDVFAQTAKEIGFVDAVFDTPETMRDAALAQLVRCSKVDQGARGNTMAFLRQSFAEKMKREEALDIADSERIGSDPVFQKTIRKVIASIADKSKKAKSNL